MMVQDMPLVWIVIPTWERCADLLACLESVQSQTYENRHVLVVDNASTDGSAAAVRTQFPKVEVCELATNQGATRASNVGFEQALQGGADYVLRLDSDTVLAADFLAELVAAALQSPHTGVFVGKIYYHNDPQRIWSTGALQNRWHLGAIELSQDELDTPHNSQTRAIDYAWSTGMLLTRPALLATGGFDPDFFVYYEEPDLCCRVRRAGLGLRFIPTAKMWHKMGHAKRSSWVGYQWARGKMLFFRKNSAGIQRLFLILYAYAYAFFRTLFPKRNGGNPGPLLSILSGLTAGLRHPL